MRRCTRLLGILLGAIIWLGSPFLGAAAPKSERGDKGLPNPFFAMDTGTKDAKHKTALEQARLAKELGYDGIGCDIRAMPAMLEAVKELDLKLYAVYVGANVDPAKPKYDPRLKAVIKSLKGRDTFVWLFVQGGKPSSTDADERAVAIIREVAELAAESGLSVSLYPHTNFYAERVEDAVRLTKKVGRKNVGITFNLCHWLKVDKEENLKPLLKQAKPYLNVVTINGADSGGKDWKTLIQPLDRGSFDMVGFLRDLKGLGFKGPIGLQHYGIKGDARENLDRSMGAWRRLSARAAAGKK